eukprot:COSAG06_NODE_11126_length_1563_cov_1.550546_1_plen_32_part_10
MNAARDYLLSAHPPVDSFSLRETPQPCQLLFV